jgi:putative flavoprotein involved in K+ transport
MRQRVGLPSPEQLPEGAVLVVGSAQSGCQITEDLLAACRSGTGAPSRRLVVQAGFMDQRPRDLPDPSMMFAAMAIVAPGRGLRRPALARAGARLVGRPVAVAGERVAFDPGRGQPGRGDAVAHRVGAMADQRIGRRSLHAPPAQPDHHDAPLDWTRRGRWTCTPRTSPAWCGAPGWPATTPGSTHPGRRRRAAPA